VIAARYDYVLDTSAILVVLLNEPESTRTTEVLRSGRDEGARIALPFLALMEIEYKLLRQMAPSDTELALQTVAEWPATIAESDEAWRRRAARVKARGGLSLADSWMAALALIHDAELVHKDPEFDSVPGLRSVRL